MQRVNSDHVIFFNHNLKNHSGIYLFLQRLTLAKVIQMKGLLNQHPRAHRRQSYCRNKQVSRCMLPDWASPRISSLFVTTKLRGGTCPWNSRQEIRTWIKKQINGLCVCVGGWMGWEGECICMCMKVLLTQTDHLIEQIWLCKYYTHMCLLQFRSTLHEW